MASADADLMTIRLLGRCSILSTPQFIRDIVVKLTHTHDAVDKSVINAVLNDELHVAGLEVCACGRHTSSLTIPAGTAIRVRKIKYQRDDVYEELPMTRDERHPKLGWYILPSGIRCTTGMDPDQTTVKHKIMLEDYAIMVSG